MDRTTAQRWIEAAIDSAWDKLHALYGDAIGKKPTIELNNRLRTTAGRAWLLHNKIDISYSLLVDFPEHFRDNTIPHEAVHFVSHRVFGHKDHGKPWKYIMAQLGLPTTPYHNMLEKRKIIQAAKAQGLTLPKQIKLDDGRTVDTLDAILSMVSE